MHPQVATGTIIDKNTATKNASKVSKNSKKHSKYSRHRHPSLFALHRQSTITMEKTASTMAAMGRIWLTVRKALIELEPFLRLSLAVRELELMLDFRVVDWVVAELRAFVRSDILLLKVVALLLRVDSSVERTLTAEYTAQT